MQARWVANEDANVEIQRGPAASSERINARIERYAINNNGSAVYFVRAETGGTERTLSSLKFEQFRSLHRRLAEEGGVLYATGGSFPRALRKARIGYATNVTLMTAGSTLAKRRFRLTPTEIGEQCEGLNAWLRETTANVEQLCVYELSRLAEHSAGRWRCRRSCDNFLGSTALRRQRGRRQRRAEGCSRGPWPRVGSAAPLRSARRCIRSVIRPICRASPGAVDLNVEIAAQTNGSQRTLS